MCQNCHVVTIDLKIYHLDLLEKACRELGWEFHRGRTDHSWYGQWVDDSPVPARLFADPAEYRRILALTRGERCRLMTEKLNRCDHVIHIPGCEYEIGVFRVGDHYELSYDYIGDIARVLGRPGQAGIHNPLPQQYARAVAKYEASLHGYLVIEQHLKDGSVQLTLHSE